MDLKQKSTEAIYEITSTTAIDLLSFDEETRDIIFKCFASITYPGENVYDNWALNIDNELILEVKILGQKNNMFIVYRIDDIHDTDVYLDYINQKKSIKWTTLTKTLTKS